MAIVHVRIDDRLIHGQVATMWTNDLSVTRIMVIDDTAANDMILKTSLKLATPNGVSLSVLSVDVAAARINQGIYDGQRVLMIVRNPMVLLDILDEGVSLTKVHVGNLTYAEGKTKITNTVAVSDHDIICFRKIFAKQVNLVLQLIPSHQEERLMAVLEKHAKGE